MHHKRPLKGLVITFVISETKKWQEEELVEHFEVQIEEASGNKKHLKNSMTSKVIMITRTMSQKMK